MLRSLRIGAPAMLLVAAPVGGRAAQTTVDDITLDVPAGYKVSNSRRGLLVKSPDGEIDVWVETFLGSESKVLMAEHAAYGKEKVELGEATASSGKSGDAAVENTDLRKATWKGDPTVVRYSAIGPFGSRDQMLLVTSWASPEGDRNLGPAVQTMIGDIGFEFPKQPDPHPARPSTCRGGPGRRRGTPTDTCRLFAACRRRAAVCAATPAGEGTAMNRITTTAAAAAVSLFAASSAHAASAANSQNGTDSSNANATLTPPTSTSAVPATTMPMGATAQPNGAGTGNAGATNPAAGTGTAGAVSGPGTGTGTAK